MSNPVFMIANEQRPRLANYIQAFKVEEAEKKPSKKEELIKTVRQLHEVYFNNGFTKQSKVDNKFVNYLNCLDSEEQEAEKKELEAEVESANNFLAIQAKEADRKREMKAIEAKRKQLRAVMKANFPNGRPDDRLH